MFNFSKPEDNDETPVQPEAEIDEETLRIRELDKKISELNLLCENFQNNYIKPVTSKLEELDKAKKEHDQDHSQKTENAKKVYYELINKLNEDHDKATQELKQNQATCRNELYTLQDQMQKLRSDLGELSKEQKELLAAKAAKEKLDTIERKLSAYLDELTKNWGTDEEGQPLKFMDFQLDDLKAMIGAFEGGRTGILNANDMGLGKTLEAVAFDHCAQQLFFDRYGYQPKTLWVTKPALIETTVREFQKWNPTRVIAPVLGRWNKDMRDWALKMGLSQNGVVITNYEALNSTKGFMDVEWDIVYCDEVHKVKGGHLPKPTLVWQNVKAIVGKSKFFVPMTGSPIQNEPGEMWSYLHIFNPQKFPTATKFKNEYCYNYYKETGGVNFKHLIKVMGDQVIRHSKEDVLKDLPEKRRRFVPLEMGDAQREVYDQMKNNFFIYLDDKKEEMVKTSVTIEWINRLRQIALYPAGVKLKDPLGNDKPKPIDCRDSIVVDTTLETVEELLSEGRHVVVFTAQYTDVLFELERRFNEEIAPGKEFSAITPDGVTTKPYKCLVAKGGLKMNNAEIQDLWNDHEIQVIFANRMSHGEGLNLQTVCQDVIMLDRWWNPEGNKQAEDRCHRKGQKNAVLVQYMDVQDSVYQFVQAKVEAKDAMIEDIMEDASLRKTGEQLKEYLKDLL